MRRKTEFDQLPREIQTSMLDCQEEQDYKRDADAFRKSLSSGFVFEETKEGHSFWTEVLLNKNFDLFFEKYPTSEEEKIEVEYEEVFKQPVNKYKVPCKGIEIDVYDVLKAYGVTCPATQHAIKKLLKSGNRGYKDNKQDLQEAIDSIKRAIELI